MSNPKEHINDTESVARAIFSPSMVDSDGRISKAAFGLRHNENYISVARMSINGWIDDIKNIPENPTRQLVGYGVLEVGEIRGSILSFFEKQIVLDVEDESTERNKSHAGITISYNDEQLQGDKKLSLKPLQPHLPASMLLLKIQSKLANLANKKFVRL